MADSKVYRVIDGRKSPDLMIDDALIPTANEKAALGAAPNALTSGNPVADKQYVDTLSLSNGAIYPIYGYDIIFQSTSQVYLNPGSTVDDSGSMNITLQSQISISLNTSGKNGLDTGTKSANAWYYLFGILNPTSSEVAGLLSSSYTSPTLPSGFTKKRFLGTVRTNSSSNIWSFGKRRYGACTETRYFEQYNTSLLILSAGTATAYTDVDASSLIPPNSHCGNFLLRSVSREAYLRMNGMTLDHIYMARDNSLYISCPTDENQVVEYRVNSGAGANLNISVFGYYEEL